MRKGKPGFQYSNVYTPVPMPGTDNTLLEGVYEYSVGTILYFSAQSRLGGMHVELTVLAKSLGPAPCAARASSRCYHWRSLAARFLRV